MQQDARGSVVRFENVSVVLDETPVLDDVSLDIKSGETVVILGASGSGKTVLLKTALGLIKPDAGCVYLLGQDITGLEERELFPIRQRVGVLFQEGGLFDSLTIEENVGYPLTNNLAGSVSEDDVRRRVEEALGFVELEHTLEKFPSELSGGMRRRVGIARAVVTEPPLVLYDSPTAGLDPITANTIIALIVKERDLKGTTTLMVTHRYQDGQLLANFRYNSNTRQLEPASRNGNRAPLQTRFIVLREGRIVFEGSQPDMERSGDVYVSKFVMRR